ncbi:hypothetical protein JW935_04485 [candidate division KSB1 bacterium]|nr:hypothetical protein [candidate division KSB1 bacterium]
MSRYVWAILIFLLILIACAKLNRFDDDCVMQIKNVGLRQGVFMRRFQLSGEYGKEKTFTSTSLKKYIQEILEPNYLLIQHAYDLGKHQQGSIQQKIQEYRIGLLADNHPIINQPLNISKERLADFYEKKSILYDIDAVQANSYNSARDIYKSILQNKEFKRPEGILPEDFPHFLQFRDVSWGEQLHPELFCVLDRMEVGQVSEPIYTSSVWTIIKLNKKSKNQQLAPFDEKDLLPQMQAISKFEQQKTLVFTLKEKYPAVIRTEYYQPMIEAYTWRDNRGWIDKAKFDDSDLNVIFIRIQDLQVTCLNFFSMFNQAKQFFKIPEIDLQDLEHFTDDTISRYVLYLDAAEKGIDRDPFLKDQLINKEHRLLLTEYLDEEISKKITISDAEALKYYQENSNKWTVEYEKVAAIIKNTLKKKAMEERRSGLIKKLQQKYRFRYNEPLLQKVAEQLSTVKQSSQQIERQADDSENL